MRPSLKGLEINFTALFHRYGEPPAVIDATFDNETSVRIYVGGEDQVHAVVFDDRGHAVKTKAAALRLDLPVVEILPQIGPLDTAEVILNEDYVRRTDSSRLFSKHFRNQLRYFPDRVPLFKEIVEETWPGVQVRELRSPRSLPGEPLSLMVRNEDFVAEVASMGHGLQMWLQTMWFLAKVQGVSCVILDEPDVYMHPDLQRRLIGYLMRRHEQVIVATHSVEMMSEVGPEDVLIVDHRRNTSSFASDVTAVSDWLEHIGSVHNLQLARLWNARKCLLVEGRDMKLLSVVHRTLFPESESLETFLTWRWGVGVAGPMQSVRRYCCATPAARRSLSIAFSIVTTIPKRPWQEDTQRQIERSKTSHMDAKGDRELLHPSGSYSPSHIPSHAGPDHCPNGTSYWFSSVEFAKSLRMKRSTRWRQRCSPITARWAPVVRTVLRAKCSSSDGRHWMAN